MNVVYGLQKKLIKLRINLFATFGEMHFLNKNKISRRRGLLIFYYVATTLLCKVLGDDAGGTADIFGAGALAVVLRSASRGHRCFIALGDRL